MMEKTVKILSLLSVILLSSCGQTNEENTSNQIITISSSLNGTIKYDDSKTYKIGDTVSFDVFPEEGYYLKSLVSNTKSTLTIVDQDTYSFKLTEKENIFTPTFVKETETINCSLSLTNTSGGTVEFSSDKCIYGTYAFFSCVPDTNYEVSKITFNQKEINLSESNVYHVSLQKNINLLDVEFKKSDKPIEENPTVKEMKITRNVIETTIDSMKDPYIGVSKESFYANYKRATSYEDAYFRSKHYFMSGDISSISHLPNSNNAIKEDGVYLKNAIANYEVDSDGNYISYEVNNLKGESYKIYYGAAYCTIEEVAAYIFAFGDVPANYTSSKSVSVSFIQSTRGEYLRLNKTIFSGDTDKYKTEPLLTDIKDKLNYYESDHGSEGGFECNGIVEKYNDGTRKIKRGTCRFVYSYSNKDNSKFKLEDRHVFYTYNHYNDFQEYLNYEGGFTARFGNETAGNEYNEINASKKPTPPHEYKLFIPNNK